MDVKLFHSFSVGTDQINRNKIIYCDHNSFLKNPDILKSIFANHQKGFIGSFFKKQTEISVEMRSTFPHGYTWHFLLKIHEQIDHIKSCPQKFIAHCPLSLLPTKIRFQNEGNLLPKVQVTLFCFQTSYLPSFSSLSLDRI